MLKLVSLQFELVTSFSEVPLKLMVYIGFFMAFFGIGFGAFLDVARLSFGALWAAQGVFTLFAVLFFLVGFQFLAFGIMGEYMGRIYREVKRRPSFTIRKVYQANEGMVLRRLEIREPESPVIYGSRDWNAPNLHP